MDFGDIYIEKYMYDIEIDAFEPDKSWHGATFDFSSYYFAGNHKDTHRELKVLNRYFEFICVEEDRVYQVSSVKYKASR